MAKKKASKRVSIKSYVRIVCGKKQTVKGYNRKKPTIKKQRRLL